MNTPRCTTLPQWPKAYPASGASATLKRLNEDFIVTEIPLQPPCGEGEHLWLDIERNSANTAFVALQHPDQGAEPEPPREEAAPRRPAGQPVPHRAA